MRGGIYGKIYKTFVWEMEIYLQVKEDMEGKILMTYNILKISTNNVTIEIYLTFVGQRWDHH